MPAYIVKCRDCKVEYGDNAALCHIAWTLDRLKYISVVVLSRPLLRTASNFSGIYKSNKKPVKVADG